MIPFFIMLGFLVLVVLSYFTLLEYFSRYYWCGREEQSLKNGASLSFYMIGEGVTRIEKERGGSSYSGKWMYRMLMARCPEFEKAE